MAELYQDLRTKYQTTGKTTMSQSETREVLMCETARLNRMQYKFKLLYQALMAGPLNQLKERISPLLPESLRPETYSEGDLAKLKSTAELYLAAINAVGISDQKLFQELPCVP
jgi:hypothetical protein